MMLWLVKYWVDYDASQLDTLEKHFDMSLRTKRYLRLGICGSNLVRHTN